ncbi:MAG: hypothetical protein AAFQ94_14925 [Bacteroidota bacterium]
MRSYLLQKEYNALKLHALVVNNPEMAQFIRQRILYEGKEMVKSGAIDKAEMQGKIQSYISLHDQQS